MQRTSLDTDAVERLRAQPFRPEDKGVPPAWWHRSPAEVVASRPPVTDAVLPLLTLDDAALRHDVALLAAWADRAGVLHAPHVKTSMAPQIIAAQVAAGAWAATVATAAQLAAVRAFGMRRVMVANPLLEPSTLAWVADELRRDHAFELLVWADSVTAAGLMDRVLDEHDSPRRVGVLVEVGAAGGRAGCRDLRTVVEVARSVRASRRLDLLGVAGWEGAFASDASSDSQRAVDGFLRRMVEATRHLETVGLLDADAGYLVSAGGSLYADRVVEKLSVCAGGTATVVLRSGSYVAHDDLHYAVASPFGRQEGLRPALRAWARVLSRPRPDLVILGVGRRDVSFDEGLPVPLDLRHADGSRSTAAGCSVTALNDQHAFLDLPPTCPLEPGDVVRLGISHPCTAFDKWRVLLVLDEDERVVDVVRTVF